MAKAESVPEKNDLVRREEEILQYWQDHKIFEKSLDQNRGGREFVFYDGPPFATGLPHYGHFLTSVIKDALPRYQTMRGSYVRRQWGWDCHGLPIENLIEKKFGLTSRKDIEDFGLEKFNEAARASVLEYATEWKKQITRIGRFVDMESDYKTMDASYTETIWWIFRQLYDKGLIYEGYKPMHICPHCETTLANFEVSQGYKDITDISVTAKFELLDEPGTFVLAWTTTPWTLPGNVALAINPDIPYIKITDGEAKYILALSRLESVVKSDYQILEEIAGADLVGKKYRPLFPYYQGVPLTNAKGEALTEPTGWQIYSATFVTTEDGTGVVHIAPAFGEDDMNLGREKNLPFIQHVGMDGRFKSAVTDWAGEKVKPLDDHQATDIKVLKHLAHQGLIYGKEKIIHSYPHCYRCQTPLLNYAASSWFVRAIDLKDKLLAQNATIGWLPEHVKEGRFGRWLEGVRDWAISRSRFWGAPLPVWRCGDCGEIFVPGSYADLKKKLKANNTYYALRHGEAEHNLRNITSGVATNNHDLTERGREEAKAAAIELKKKGITRIVHSGFVRTRETAAIVARELGLAEDKIIVEPRLGEINFGFLEGHPVSEYQDYYQSNLEKFQKALPNGESMADVKTRVTTALLDLEQGYAGETILLVTHESAIWLLAALADGLSPAQAAALRDNRTDYVATGSLQMLDYAPCPHNGNHELDFHRPYIDRITWACACGGEYRRVPEVFDCWFESGSMPYASKHYPFANQEIFDPVMERGYPADFIGEGQDQTRGWFYSMLVLGTALFGQTPYRNVIVNGMILAEDGQKMSKSLKNYPDPMLIVDKYGADALRFYLLSSPVVRAEDLFFSERGVSEVSRKIVGRLFNVYSFFTMYAGEQVLAASADGEEHLLDQWIKARLKETELAVRQAMDNYELDRATRPLDDFIDDLSNWYVRRSRERLKEETADGRAALITLRAVLLTLTKLLAPFTPFVADYLFLRLRGEHDPLSVHLASWPRGEGELTIEEQKLVSGMKLARGVVSAGLEARAAMSLRVRQPLAAITIKTILPPEYQEIIKDELNVKQVRVDQTMSPAVALDTELSPALLAEGNVRELIRYLQDYRKQLGLSPKDRVAVEIKTDARGEELVTSFDTAIQSAVGADEIKFGKATDGLEVMIGEQEFRVLLRPL